LLITGIGGDELACEDTFYRHEWEVKGYSSLSSITAAAGRCDMFMRMGIWVAQPFVHPIVVNFCRALPAKMREHRLIHFLTLARAGLSDGFLFPRFQEHYGNLIQYEAARFDFERALEGSVLADYGIDYGDLLTRAYDAGYGGFSYALINELWRYLKLDAVLKRYITS
jgi:asparagine synthase (glutamine-hydrolysing)